MAVCNSVVEGYYAAAALKDPLPWAKVLVAGSTVEEHCVESVVISERSGTEEADAVV